MYRYLVLCVGLIACVPAGGEFASPHTGLVGSYSEQVVISDHPHHVLYGHVVDITDGRERTRALVISHRRDGVHRFRIYEAWAFGRELPYRRMNRHLGCTHGHCRNDAVGMIPLGPEMIARGVEQGLSARLIGPQGGIDIHVAPALFRPLLAE